jgi:hypothetical protein
MWAGRDVVSTFSAAPARAQRRDTGAVRKATWSHAAVRPTTLT